MEGGFDVNKFYLETVVWDIFSSYNSSGLEEYHGKMALFIPGFSVGFISSVWENEGPAIGNLKSNIHF